MSAGTADQLEKQLDINQNWNANQTKTVYTKCDDSQRMLLDIICKHVNKAKRQKQVKKESAIRNWNKFNKRASKTK